MKTPSSEHGRGLVLSFYTDQTYTVFSCGHSTEKFMSDVGVNNFPTSGLVH